MSGKAKAIASYLKYQYLEVATAKAESEDWQAYAKALEQLISDAIGLLEDR